MAELYRKRYDGVDAVTLGAAISSSGATSVTFAAALQSMGTNIATLAADEYLPLVIDNEIIYLTAYTAAATTGTISRGKEGTTAATHANGASVIPGPTVQDFSPLASPYTLVVPHMLYPDTSVGAWAVSLTGSALPYYVSSGTQNDEIVWLLPIGPGTYDIRGMVFRDTNRGIATVAIDDGASSYTTAGTMDTYGASGTGIALSITGAVVTGAATTRRIRLKMATKNASSSGYFLCLHNFTIIRTG